MPRPLSLYKDGAVQTNVYPSEVDGWLANGWSAEPPIEVKEEESEDALAVRVKEIQALTWRQVKAIVDKLNTKNPELNLEKPDNVNYDDYDFVLAVAKAELGES